MFTMFHVKHWRKAVLIMARFTLYGLYQYQPTLFDSSPFPEKGNKDIFIDTLMQRHGMLYMYQQVGDEVAERNITNWFTRNLYNFEQLFSALYADYNPIENYDRKEDWTDTPDVSYTKSGGHENTIENQSDITQENTVSAFNSASYEPNTKNTSEDKGHSTETLVYNEEATKETGTRKHDGRIHGNIGVTTNQNMIQEEIQLRQFDLYNYIADLFAKEFLIQVY